MTILDRRNFLVGAGAALGLGAAVGTRALAAAVQAKSTGAAVGAAGLIDIHHHFAPPSWLAAVKGRPLLQAATSAWTPAKSLADMDQGGVATAIISVTNPGLWFGDKAETARLARECNDYAAKMMQDHPGRFGLFAAMPMPDVDATLHEIDYAYSALHADGVGLFTNYGDTWLGNPAYRPVMEELNRRKALVHVHPIAGNCCRDLNYAPDVPPASMEYGTDTTRAIIGVTFSGDAAKYSDIRFIWSHAGGTVPFLAGRIAKADRTLKNREERLPKGFLYELQKFNYDIAGADNIGAISSLMKLVTADNVLFGTDFPAGESSTEVAKAMTQMGFSDSDLRAINRGNALRLLPHLGA